MNSTVYQYSYCALLTLSLGATVNAFALSPYPTASSGDLFSGIQGIENPANVSHVISEGQSATINLGGGGHIWINDPSGFFDLYNDTNSLLSSDINSSSSEALESLISDFSKSKYYLSYLAESGFSTSFPISQKMGLELSYRRSNSLYQSIKVNQGLTINSATLFSATSTLTAESFLDLVDSDLALKNLHLSSQEIGLGLSNAFDISEHWSLAMGGRLRMTELEYTANLVDLRGILQSITASSSAVSINQLVNDYTGPSNRSKKTMYLDGDFGILLADEYNHFNFWVTNLNNKTLIFPDYSSTCDTAENCAVSVQYSDLDVLQLDRRYRLGYARYSNSRWFQLRILGDILEWKDLGGKSNQFVVIATKLGSRRPKEKRSGHSSPEFQLSHSINLPTNEAYTSISFKVWWFSLGLGFTPKVRDFLSRQGESIAPEDIGDDLLYVHFRLGVDARF